MKTYNLYRIEKNGEPRKKQTIHGNTIDSAWCGCKYWYSDGTFLMTSSDGTEAKIFILNRGDQKQ